MKQCNSFLAVVLAIAWAAIPAQAIEFDLRFDKLVDALQLLPDADRESVNGVISMIKRGAHQEALQRLKVLNGGNPENSSLRLMTAYALLQVGNALGALQEADKAHEASNGNSYKCWFYSKVALLNGQSEACKRELSHVKKAGDMPEEVKALEKEMKEQQKKKS